MCAIAGIVIPLALLKGFGSRVRRLAEVGAELDGGCPPLATILAGPECTGTGHLRRRLLTSNLSWALSASKPVQSLGRSW